MSAVEHTEVRTAALDGWFVERIAETTLNAAAGPAGTLVERVAPRRGVMAPLHARTEDETYHVLTGELTFFVGDEIVRARAGDVVVAPRGVPHTYRVESDGTRWLVLTRLVSVARFEDFGRALAEPQSVWDGRLAERGGGCGLGRHRRGQRDHRPGPPGMLPAQL